MPSLWFLEKQAVDRENMDLYIFKCFENRSLLRSVGVHVFENRHLLPKHVENGPIHALEIDACPAS